ncbi:MAG: nucleoside:proton symporter, partial [Actinomycetota bacterium]
PAEPAEARHGSSPSRPAAVPSPPGDGDGEAPDHPATDATVSPERTEAKASPAPTASPSPSETPTPEKD